jgi:hypothetical protein
MEEGQVEVRQVEKVADCAHLVKDLWINGKAPTDDRHLQAYVVCPLSGAPAHYPGGEKMLVTVQEADLNFIPTSEPMGWAAEAFPSKAGTKNLLRFITMVQVNADRTSNGRSTYTLWRNIGDRYVMADFATPDEASSSLAQPASEPGPAS